MELAVVAVAVTVTVVVCVTETLAGLAMLRWIIVGGGGGRTFDAAQLRKALPPAQ